jgi:glycosyltransferase involved in cell wall biosynthesis
MVIPEYSIVIPNLHSPRIGEVLEALRRQERVNRSIYEILVVGRDKYGLVMKHVADDKRIRFLESERDINPAEARNRGIKASRGKLVFLLMRIV